MKTWQRNGYEVVEEDFDHGLHVLSVFQNGESVIKIVPDSIESMNQLKDDLDNGEEIDGWEDGLGNVIHVEREKQFKNINTDKIISESQLEKLHMNEYKEFWEEQRGAAEDFETEKDYIQYMLKNDEPDFDFVECEDKVIIHAGEMEHEPAKTKVLESSWERE